MTKEELRTRLLEIEEQMKNNFNELTYRDYDKLLYQLREVLLNDLGDMAVEVVAKTIVNRDNVDLDYLASEYLDCGDLEKAFKEVSDLEDNFEVTKTIIK